MSINWCSFIKKILFHGLSLKKIRCKHLKVYSLRLGGIKSKVDVSGTVFKKKDKNDIMKGKEKDIEKSR